MGHPRGSAAGVLLPRRGAAAHFIADTRQQATGNSNFSKVPGRNIANGATTRHTSRQQRLQIVCAATTHPLLPRGRRVPHTTHLDKSHQQWPLPVMGGIDRSYSEAEFPRSKRNNKRAWSKNKNESEIHKNVGKRRRRQGRYGGGRLLNINMLPHYLQPTG